MNADDEYYQKIEQFIKDAEEELEEKEQKIAELQKVIIEYEEDQQDQYDKYDKLMFEYERLKEEMSQIAPEGLSSNMPTYIQLLQSIENLENQKQREIDQLQETSINQIHQLRVQIQDWQQKLYDQEESSHELQQKIKELQFQVREEQNQQKQVVRDYENRIEMVKKNINHDNHVEYLKKLDESNQKLQYEFDKKLFEQIQVLKYSQKYSQDDFIKQINEYEKKIGSMKDEIEKQKEMIDQENKLIDELEGEKKNVWIELQNQEKQYKDTVDSYESKVQEQETQIQSLRKQVDELNMLQSQQQKQLLQISQYNQYNKSIANLQKQLQSKQTGDWGQQQIGMLDSRYGQQIGGGYQDLYKMSGLKSMNIEQRCSMIKDFSNNHDLQLKQMLQQIKEQQGSESDSYQHKSEDLDQEQQQQFKQRQSTHIIDQLTSSQKDAESDDQSDENSQKLKELISISQKKQDNVDQEQSIKKQYLIEEEQNENKEEQKQKQRQRQVKFKSVIRKVKTIIRPKIENEKMKELKDNEEKHLMKQIEVLEERLKQMEEKYEGIKDENRILNEEMKKQIEIEQGIDIDVWQLGIGQEGKVCWMG